MMPSTCSRPSEGLQKACRRHSALELAPGGTFFGSPTPHRRISTRLTGTCTGMSGRTECSDSQYPSTFMICCIGLCALASRQYPSSLWKFGELGPYFDKINSRSSYESDGGVYQESETMLYSRYNWTMLGIRYSSDSINYPKRWNGLVLKHTIIQN